MPKRHCVRQRALGVRERRPNRKGAPRMGCGVAKSGQHFRPRGEVLERRDLLAAGIDPPIIRAWQPVGPAPVINGATQGLEGFDPVSGAVQALGVQHDDPATGIDESRIVHIGSVNGGVWRTRNILAGNVVWEPLTDHLPSASIGAIAVSPTNPNLVLAGTGKFSNYYGLGAQPVGLYRTIEGNLISDTRLPKWEHFNSMKLIGQKEKSNIFAGLPITSIVFSRTSGAAPQEVILVGTTGSRGGLYRSADGGNVWTHISGSINAPDGVDNNNNQKVDEPGEVNPNDNEDNDGDGTIDNANEVNLPPGPIYDLAAVPNSSIVFAASKLNGGVFRSTDGGNKWVAVAANLPGRPLGPASMRLAVHVTPNPGGQDIRAVYAAYVATDKLHSIFQSFDLGENWTPMTLPPDLHPGKQGIKNFSFVAHPTLTNVVFVGGDTQPSTDVNGCTGYYGRVFRGIVATNGNTTWDFMTCNSANGTSPHADSRDMVFLPGHPDKLLQVDDGGVYLLESVDTPANRRWSARVGNLQVAEVTHVAYDTANDVFFAGLQDNGVVEQQAVGDLEWTEALLGMDATASCPVIGTCTVSVTPPYFKGGDGYSVAADPFSPRDHFTMQNNYKSFYHSRYTQPGVAVDLDTATTNYAETVALGGMGVAEYNLSGAYDIPMTFNPYAANRMVVGLIDLYESKNRGKSVELIESQSAAGALRNTWVSAIAAGAAGHPEVLYVARGNNVAVRRPGNAKNVLSPSVKKGDTVTTCSGVVGTANFDYVGTVLGKNPILDIAINPDDWEEAFAVDNGNLYHTRDGGSCWNKFPLDASSIGFFANSQTIEIVNPTANLGDEVLFVGTERGVYRAVRSPAGDVVRFVKFGTNLPNVVVKDMHYEATDDFLYVGTLGRGVWKLNDVDNALPVLTVTGTNADDTITLFRDSSDKSKLRVKIGNTTFAPVNIETVDSILIHGHQGSDTLVIDNTAGYFADFGGASKSLTVTFHAGENSGDQDAITLLPSGVARERLKAEVSQPDNAEFGTITMFTDKVSRPVHIDFFDVELPVGSGIAGTVFSSVSAGLQETADMLASLSESGDRGFARSMTDFLNAIPPVSSDRPTRTFAPEGVAAHLGDPAFEASPTDAMPFLRRMIETGANAIRLDELGLDENGNPITDLAVIQAALDDLDDIPGNVAVTETTNGQAPETRFDVQIEKRMFSAVLLDGLDLTGRVTVDATADLFADVRARLVFGVDSKGFFLDPNPIDAAGSPLGPEFTVRNIVGTVTADARLGFLDASLLGGTLQTDPDVEFQLDIVAPLANPPADGRLRISDWRQRSVRDLATLELVGDPDDDVPDLTISGDFTADLFEFANLPTIGLTIEWPDISNLGSGVVRPRDGGALSGILDVLNANMDDIVVGIETLSGAIEQATGVDVLSTKVPLINKSIGEILEGVPEPLDIPPAALITVTEPETEDDTTTFHLHFRELQVADLGLALGNTVEYQSAATGATVSAQVSALGQHTITLNYPAGEARVPAAGTSFRVHRDGSLQSQFRSLLNGIAINVPTLQDLVSELEALTGIQLFDQVEIMGTPGSADFAIQIPLVFDPTPKTFRLPIDFADRLPGLDLSAAATLEVAVDPKFEFTLGISLAKTRPDGTPLGILERVYVVATRDDVAPGAGLPQPTGRPLVTLDVIGRLNDPVVTGSFGFLNVGLQEIVPPGAPPDDPNTPQDEDGNQGIQLTLTTTLDLLDPDTGAPDQRIALGDLAADFLDVAQLDLSGALDIDGLRLAAAVGTSLELGELTISLDGEGATAPGRITGLADLTRLVSPGPGEEGIVVDGKLTAFESFANIGPEQIFAALQLIIDQLQELGAGEVFDKPIPLINKSISDLVDLGETWSQAVGSPGSAGSVATAQQLEAFLNSKLGSAANPDVVDVTVRENDVLFDFQVGHDFHRLLPLAFNVGQGGIGLIGSGNIGLDACADLNLRLGISTAPGLPFSQRLFLDTAPANELSVRIVANAGYTAAVPTGCGSGSAGGAMNFSATVGPLGLTIADGRALLDLTLGADLSAPGNRLVLASLANAAIQPTLAGEFQALVPLDGDGDGVADLPADLSPNDARIEVAGRVTSLDGINFQLLADPAAADDLPHRANPAEPLSSIPGPGNDQLDGIPVGTVRIVTHNLTGLIQNSFLNFGTIVTGLEQFIDWADRFLGIDALDYEIPFIGRSLRDGLNFLQSDRPGAKTVRTLVDTLIQNGAAGLGANTSDDQVLQALQALREALRQLPGIVPVVDADGDETLENATITQNGVTILQTGDDLVRVDREGDQPTGRILGVTFLLRYAPSFVINFPFDLGLDFLRFEANATGQVHFIGNLGLQLAFGVHRDLGFFVDTSEAAMPGPEFSISGLIQPDVDLAARLGFVDVAASLDGAQNYLAATFSADLAGGADNRLTLDELLDFGNFATLIPPANRHLEVEAHLHAAITTGISSAPGSGQACTGPVNGGPPPGGGAFPTVSGTLQLDWAAPTGTATTAVDPNVNDGRPFDVLQAAAPAPEIALRNIQLDVGSFLSDLVKPVFQRIQQSNLIPPSLIDLMNRELPLLEKTLRDLLTETLSPTQAKVFDFVFDLASFLTDANSEMSAATARNYVIQFGDIEITRDPLRADAALADPVLDDDDVTTSEGEPAEDKTVPGTNLEIPGSGLPLVGDFFQRLGEIGIFFPVIRLSNLSQLIVGNDIDLVFIDLPALELKKTFSQDIPLVGVDADPLFAIAATLDISGELGLTINISGGFDTSGLRNGRFLDGLYLGDFDPGTNGQIDPGDDERYEVHLAGHVEAAISGTASVLGFDIAKISGYFRLIAGLHADLNDDNEVEDVVPACDRRSPEDRFDGKMHFGEMQTVVRSHGDRLLSVLDLGGSLTAQLGVRATVLDGLLLDKSIYREFPLASFALTFPVDCPPETGGGGGGGGGEDNPPGPARFVVDPLAGVTLDLNPPGSLEESGAEEWFVDAFDLNGDVFDGFEVAEFELDELVGQDLGDEIVFELVSEGVDLADSGIAPGQGVAWEQNGIAMGGVVGSVIGNQITITGVRAFQLPGGGEGGGEGVLALTGNLSVLSGAETIVVQSGGFVQQFGPTQCGPAFLPDINSVAGIVTGSPLGLGSGNNRLAVGGRVTTPVKVQGGGGDDTILGGAGALIADGGRGNDRLVSASRSQRPGSPSTLPAGASLSGGSGRDVIIGGRGSDVLLGGDGDDLVVDSPGKVPPDAAAQGIDRLVGGGGRDALLARGGDDLLVGDYDAVHDPRPAETGRQREDEDVLQHQSLGKPTVFGDNHGASLDEPGLPPSPLRNTTDQIVVEDPRANVFSDHGDALRGSENRGNVFLSAGFQNVTLYANQVAVAGMRPIHVRAGNVVHVADAGGRVVVAGGPEDDSVTLAAHPKGIALSFAGGADIIVEGATQVSFAGGTGADEWVLDFSQGHPIPLEGASILGQGSAKAEGDRLLILGSGGEKLRMAASPRTPDTGTLTVDDRDVELSGIRTVEVSRVAAGSWVTPGGGDVLTLRGGTAAGGVAAMQLSGVTNRTLWPQVIFYDVGSVVLDAGGADTTASDRVSLAGGAFAARGLRSLAISTGAGADVVQLDSPDFRLPDSGGSLTVDGGGGQDQLVVRGDADFTLNGDTATLGSSAGGTLRLVNLSGDRVQLTGGASANRFAVTNWPGSVTLDGAAGADSLVLATRGGTLTTIDELILAAPVTVNAASSPAVVQGRLALGTTTRAFTVADGAATPDLQLDAVLSGTGGLTKSGAGRMLLSQNNSYSGTTTVTAGVLHVEGSQSSAVVLSGGTLLGNALVGSVTGTSGTLAPGASSGLLEVRGPLSLASRNVLQVELNGTTPGRTSGGYDVLLVSGSVNLGGSQLLATVGFSSTPGNSFRILENDGTDAIVGTFAGLAEGATFTASGFTFTISYRGGTGNDVVLTHVKNVAPAFPNRAVTASIEENGVVTVTGQITEQDVGDLFTLVVDWRDGSPIEEFEFDPRLGLDVRIQHRYTDDPPGDAGSDERVIDLLWRDQHGAANRGTLVTTVHNVAPQVEARAQVPLSQGASLRAAGRFTDPGTDSWFATVDFGDGGGPEPLPLRTDGSFELTHRYIAAGMFSVKVTVTDDDGGAGQTEFPVRAVAGPNGDVSLLWWQNPRLSADVNDDGHVVPHDALYIINRLNAEGPSDLSQILEELDLNQPAYLDPNGDNFLSPLDVLQVVNYLNAHASEGDGEGELVLAETLLAAVLPAPSLPESRLSEPTAELAVQPSGAHDARPPQSSSPSSWIGSAPERDVPNRSADEPRDSLYADVETLFDLLRHLDDPG